MATRREHWLSVTSVGYSAVLFGCALRFPCLTLLYVSSMHGTALLARGLKWVVHAWLVNLAERLQICCAGG